MGRSKIAFIAVQIGFLLALASCRRLKGPEPVRSWSNPTVTQQESGTDALLIGLDAVNDEIVWASGTGGTFVRTLDGGASWVAGTVPGADTLQFRDVHAFGPDSAYLLSIGHGSASRIYKTTDGGQSWTEAFVNQIEHAFFDCFDFWSDESGMAFSDAVDGRFPLATMSNGVWSATWGPDAQPNEGGFAASGTCLVAVAEQSVLIGTGNADVAHVLRSDDRGGTWSSAPTPVVAGEGAGITTLAFRDDRHGMALGGDLAQPEAYTDNVAVTDNGGQTWRLAAAPTFPGAVYGSSTVPGTTLLVAVGPNGASYTRDDATTWTALDSLNYWSTDFATAQSGWMVGPDGRIAKVSFQLDDSP